MSRKDLQGILADKDKEKTIRQKLNVRQTGTFAEGLTPDDAVIPVSAGGATPSLQTTDAKPVSRPQRSVQHRFNLQWRMYHVKLLAIQREAMAVCYRATGRSRRMFANAQNDLPACQRHERSRDFEPQPIWI